MEIESNKPDPNELTAGCSSRQEVIMVIESGKPDPEALTISSGRSPLSETLWKDRDNTEFIGDVSARLTWQDLTVLVALKNGKTRVVLDNITGFAEPGTFTALMGPSGSGKSTLLDALAGRLATNMFSKGTILLNGRKRKLSCGNAAYVTQDDNLIGTLTVRETISYSAQLRLPDRMPWIEKQALIEGTIVEMGLQDCADTAIGNWHLRGISGGERRRVSIAVEILMRPRLLLLDEPTSGLDSASAFFVTQTLSCLARDGRTVIASIHQPSSEVFELFDSLFLLSGGKTIFFGKALDTYEFFAQAGLPCPDRRRPSDHFLRCVNSDFDKVKSTLKDTIVYQRDDDPVEKMSTVESIKRLTDFYNRSHFCSAARQRGDDISRIKGPALDYGGSQASIIKQTCTLTKRSFVNMSRDFGYYWLRLLVYISLAISVGTIFMNLGTRFSSILARGSGASFVFVFVTFLSIVGFPSFAEDMKVFQKERLNKHYGVFAFVMANTFSALPFLMLISFSSATICYYMMHLHPGFTHYIFFILSSFACVFVVESLMMVIASVVPNFLMGIVIGAGIQGVFMLVSGFFRLPSDIPKPVWRYPVMYLSFHYWAQQGQFQNDFKGLLFDNQTPGQPKTSGEDVLKTFYENNTKRSKWVDLIVLFCMIIVYRLLFFMMIKFNEEVTPRIRGFFARRTLNKNIGGANPSGLASRAPSFRSYMHGNKNDDG